MVALAAPTGLVVIWGLVTVPAYLAFMVWFWVRVYFLSVPALMLEPVGDLRRHGPRLPAHPPQFWRTFGIALLTVVVIGIAEQHPRLPDRHHRAGRLARGRRPSTRCSSSSSPTRCPRWSRPAFVTPFTSAVTSLQYLDQRMRKEAYDVELMQQAGITG